MSYASVLYDGIRLDHFRGFDRYYAIPWGSEDATCGRWEPGPGISLFDALNRAGVSCRYVAEDLGFVTEEVRSLLAECGFPGMKIVQFGFDSRDSSSNEHIPHNYTSGSVVYTGTHDNHTVKGWYKSIDADSKKMVRAYFGAENDGDVYRAMVRCAMSSVCNLCIIPLQDWLELGDDARINTPGTFGDNWSWRLSDLSCLEAIVGDIRSMTELYGR
jgi:4-alpha-glucanotransferase